MPNNKPQTTVRFDNHRQIARVLQAARSKKWSLSRFVSESAVEAADKILGKPARRERKSEIPAAEVCETLKDASDPQTLNQ
jgi:uncharacterized protein (DUF1778 family)